MAAPKDHVRRETLPWRATDGRTECGRQVDSVAASIPRAEWHEIAAEWGRLQRDYRQAGMTIPASVRRPNVCGTCWDVAARQPTWERNPIASIARFVDDHTSDWVTPDVKPVRQQVARELWALGRLAQEFPVEYRRLVADMEHGYRRHDPVLY